MTEEEKLRNFLSELSNKYKKIREQNEKLMSLIKQVIDWDYEPILKESGFYDDADQLINELKNLENYYKTVNGVVKNGN